VFLFGGEDNKKSDVESVQAHALKTIIQYQCCCKEENSDQHHCANNMLIYAYMVVRFRACLRSFTFTLYMHAYGHIVVVAFSKDN